MSTPSGTPVLRRPLLLLWALVAALPVVYILSQVIASSRNIVFWDEFNSLDFVLRLDRHLGWRELIDRFFSIDSEHRTVTTRLIFALSYWVTGSINFHLIGAIGNLSLVALCAVLIARMESADRRARFAVVIAFGLFQLEHFESFVWSGASIDHFMVLFFAGAAFVALQHPSWPGTVAAMVLAFLATFTLAQGCVTWLVGAAILWRERRWRHLNGWLACAALVLGLYLRGFSVHPEHRLGDIQPAEFARLAEYWLALLGSAAVLGQRMLAPWAGAVLLGLNAWLLARRTWRREPIAMPVAWFGIGALAMVALGRVAVAPHEINSRYFVLSALAWTMTVFMVLESLRQPERPFRVLAFALPLLALFNVAADARFAPQVESFVEARERAASRFAQFGQDGHGVSRLNPFEGRAEDVLARAEMLGVYRLPRYSKRVEFPFAQAGTRINFTIDEVVTNGRAVSVQGWATVPGRLSRAGQVFVVLRSPKTFLVFSALTQRRPDVVQAYREPRFMRSGFCAVIERGELPAEDFDVGLLTTIDGRAEYTMTTHRVLLSSAVPGVARLASHE
jgi:hypothetical protein